MLLVIYLSAISSLSAQQQDSLPPQTEVSYDPSYLFEEIWDYFEMHYAHFDLRGVNWHQAYGQFRPRLNSETPPEELFGLFCEMLAPFEDPNVVLYAPDLKRIYRAGPETEFQREFTDQGYIDDFWELCNKTLHRKGISKLEQSSEGNYYYGRGSNFSYLRINNFEAYDLEYTLKETDSILGALGNGYQPIIIDLRSNTGGNTELAIELARRFTPDERVGLVTQTRNGPGKRDFSPEDSIYLYPSGAHQRGKIVLLVNDATTGAAETFALTLRYMKHVKIIGEKTGGALSEPFYLTMRNGWQVGVPNKRIYAANMATYDGKGIPVNKTIVNSRFDLDGQDEPLITAALELF